MKNLQVKEINDNFCFRPNRSINASDTHAALTMYANLFDTSLKLEGDLPIFLDANILLGFYGMSKDQKAKLLMFFDTHKDRIIITKQIEKEYLRNRLSTINKDFFSPLNDVIEGFDGIKIEIKNKLNSYKESKRKILSKDFSDLWDKFRGLESEIIKVLDDEDFYNQMCEKINETTQDNKNIAILDDLLTIVASIRTTDELSDKELNFINSLYDTLGEDRKNARETVKYRFAFPGCGEKKENDKAGDFVIYHEIIKYMEVNNTSCILLTKDVTKGDWLQPSRQPYNHYIENTYIATNNILYIIDAEKALEDISFENIHKVQQNASFEELKEESAAPVEIKESTIINIDKKNGYGFIYTKYGNLYFNASDLVEGDFKDLEKEDIVQFTEGTNNRGEVNAQNVKKISYSFEADTPIYTSKIAHINLHKGIGFISYQPENLYFHQSFVDIKTDFDDLKVGDEIEFIVGKNSEGEQIARLVRRKE